MTGIEICKKCRGEGLVTCPACGGKGKLQNDEENECPMCKGKGKVICSLCAGHKITDMPVIA